MRFKHLQLKKARQFVVHPASSSPKLIGRRNFVKALGLGSIAWNPFIGSLKAMNSSSISVQKTRNGLTVSKNGRKVWQFSNAVFEKGFNVQHTESDNYHRIKATRLKFKGTNLRFSVYAGITKNGNHCDLTIPEFDYQNSFCFNDWIDDISDIKKTASMRNSLLRLNSHAQVDLDGQFTINLKPDWSVDLQSNNKIRCCLNNSEYFCSDLTITPSGHPLFIKSSINKSTRITVHDFKGWQEYISQTKLKEGQFISRQNEIVPLNIETGTIQLLWINTIVSHLKFKPGNFNDSEIPIDHIFCYSEYLEQDKTNQYIAAGLPKGGTWIQNKLGAFKLEQNDKIPDIEAFGLNSHFDQVILEPNLKSFKPKIENATTLSAEYLQSDPIRILNTNDSTNFTDSSNPQEPVRRTTQQIQQKDIRKVKPTQQKLEIQYDQIKFKPQSAISIKVLRPEDMVMLEFVFHNFSFIHKNQTSYLELDNAKKPGVIYVYFQSQHTLEEAYYESTAIPEPGFHLTSAGDIQLPAKHLRARKSRLVYELPANSEGFPLIMEALLDWSKFNLRVHPRAWIKLPTLRVAKRPMRLQLDKKTRIQPNKKLKYLDSPSTDFGIKLAENNASKVRNLQVYDDNEIQKVLKPEAAATIKPSFNAAIIKNIVWKVEPIPESSTSIEAPTLMYISPNQTNDFYHKTQVEFRNTEDLTINKNQQLKTEFRILDRLSTNKGEVSELWHTRLGVKLRNNKISGTALPHLKTIRALWADDADENYEVAKERNYPFMASLDANNRQKLVHTTSNYLAGFTPFPVPVNDLMLTTLGAYLDWHAFFDVPTPQDTYLNIIEWEHIATLGRDHFVKIVEEGYLFPFGHRAAVVKITERKFHPQTKAALNRQRMFVVVLEKEVLYSRNDPNGNFIEFPFQAIRIKTEKTPNIDNPEQSTLITVSANNGGSNRFKLANSGANTTYNFYINVANAPFQFDIVATDKEGKEHAFRMPLAFMENRIARDSSLMEQVIEEYRGKASNSYNSTYTETDFNGQEVAYSEFLVDGDTSFETEMIKFDAQIYPVQAVGEIKFHPKMKEAKVFVEQISELTGIREPVIIGLEDDNNDGEVFARVTSNNRIDFSGGSDKSGGFLVPNMGVSGLSKLQGPINGKLDDLKALNFVPNEFFEVFDDLPVAKIFGVIDIFSLLFGKSGSPLELGGAFNGMKNAVSSIREDIDDIKNQILLLEEEAENGQQLIQDQINSLKQAIKDKVNELLQALNDAIPRIPNLKTYLTEEAFYAEYKWQPELGGETMEIIPDLLNVNVDNPSNALSITTKFEKPFDADKPASMNGKARFEKFGIDIVPLLAVKFNYLEFKTGSSEKTDVKVDIDKNDPIQFKGVLNFVNNLQSVIPSDGFSDSGPYIKLKPTGVTAGFDLAIPNVEVGICMISNISLGANITLPFTGAPLTMGFNFCKRENPFLLTISCFGGGGYFMMVTTLQGIQSLEAAFEFGAAMSLNVGVASGGVSAMGGFYYKMEIVEGEKTTTLTGYLRLNGHLSILGLISLSLEFYLAFSAVIINDKVQKLEGEATLKVKVEVLFFSKTVKVTVRRELKGADADPKFIEMIDEDDWQEYCAAFAS
nr:hypothetical protein [uncultured Carboxylicivirga sp.]